MEDSLLYTPTDEGHPQREIIVRARVPWHGHQRDVTGVLKPGLLLIGHRVLVPLENVRPPLPGDGGTDLWVDVRLLRPAPPAGAESSTEIAPPSFILRSNIHELPGDRRQDYALRALSVTLSGFVGSGALYAALAPGVENMMELTLVIDVFDASADPLNYFWRFSEATRPGINREALWIPPEPPFAAARLLRERARASHHIGQLPLWLTTRRFWSVFRWHEGRLEHILQFSVPNKFRRTLVGRFRLQPPATLSLSPTNAFDELSGQRLRFPGRQVPRG